MSARMDLAGYFDSVYDLLSQMFQASGNVENSVVVGAARELVAGQLLSFLPGEKRTGWVLSHTGRMTGQLDLVLCVAEALALPATVGDSTVSGTFGTQTYAAIEVKSNISTHIKAIMRKAWHCHRIAGGLGRTAVPASANGKQVFIKWPDSVPLCVIGAKGFDDVSLYDEHFKKVKEYSPYRVNTVEVESPENPAQVTPDLLLDFTHNTLLVSNDLQPAVIASVTGDDGAKFDHFTAFKGISGAVALTALVYYLDTARSALQNAKHGGPLADVLHRMSSTPKP